mmetsp:Transcript_28369/g.51279  ORF Transcript_28369/g.51279 Transcript_28369/m.51279 type:complete len:109 (-) Transcript_28369:13-339(-)
MALAAAVSGRKMSMAAVGRMAWVEWGRRVSRVRSWRKDDADDDGGELPLSRERRRWVTMVYQWCEKVEITTDKLSQRRETGVNLKAEGHSRIEEKNRRRQEIYLNLLQ